MGGLVGQADHGYTVPEPDVGVRLESLTYMRRACRCRYLFIKITSTAS
jgi:hypothetical protein